MPGANLPRLEGALHKHLIIQCRRSPWRMPGLGDVGQGADVASTLTLAALVCMRSPVLTMHHSQVVAVSVIDTYAPNVNAIAR